MTLISFDVHIFCFCDDDGDADYDDEDDIAIVHGLKTMFFQTCIVLHGIVLCCMLPGCIDTKEVILGDWRDNAMVLHRVEPEQFAGMLGRY